VHEQDDGGEGYESGCTEEYWLNEHIEKILKERIGQHRAGGEGGTEGRCKVKNKSRVHIEA